MPPPFRCRRAHPTLKAGIQHQGGVWPFLVGFQENGGSKDLAALTQGASAKYQKPHEAHYVRGEDPETGQNAGTILDASRGVGSGRQASAG